MIAGFSDKLLTWFTQHGRHHLPWQVNKTPYHVWLSEIMLQQTQVGTVIPYYQRFIEQYPDVQSLAHASLDQVLHLWSGLGYYTRARNLHRSAQHIINDHQGIFPNRIETLAALPGIGRSTAGAIVAQAYNKQATILDGNVKRVLCRTHTISGWPGQSRVEKQLWQLAEHYTPEENVANYAQAIMDLGATVCKRSKPLCSTCPLAADCLAYQSKQIANFPEKKPKKTLPIRQAYFLILQNQEQEILLEKQALSGLWGGLWCLPTCPLDTDYQQWCKQRYQVNIISQHSLASFRHSFSHFHLDISPIVLEVKTGLAANEETHRRWFSINKSPSIGLSAPVKAILSELLVPMLPR